MLLLLLAGTSSLRAQVQPGRVVINEYMPWTLQECGTTAEFVELLNFGPGPIDISCYIVTDGDFAVTIPAGTVLQPGEFYVLAGRDIIEAPCANVDSTIQVDLNWTTCGCTSDPIPTTGEGFFSDGGTGNDPVVLLDPQKRVVDAVVRGLPVEPASPLATFASGCGSVAFDLDTMNIRYEELGMSTGRGNSFARKLDGDCGWIKEPQQTANASNNTPGDFSDIQYELTITQSMDCDTTRGAVDIYVKHFDYTQIFPMNWVIAFDADEDGDFDYDDSYGYGLDSIAPNISIDGLGIGRYRLTVGSTLGCFLETFDFSILPCSMVLPVRLQSFTLSGTEPGWDGLRWLVAGDATLSAMVIERALRGGTFSEVARIRPDAGTGGSYTYRLPASGRGTAYRLKLEMPNGKAVYSSILYNSESASTALRAWPNPASKHLYLRLAATRGETAPWTVYNSAGQPVRNGTLALAAGENGLELSLAGLPAGLYQFSIRLAAQPFTLRFVKESD